MAHKLLGVLAFNLIILQHILDHLMEKKCFAKPFQLLKKLCFLRKKNISHSNKISCLYANFALMLSKWHQHDIRFLGLYQSLYHSAKNITSRKNYYDFISVF